MPVSLGQSRSQMDSVKDTAPETITRIDAKSTIA